MSEAQNARKSATGIALLWPILAICYLAASAGGYRNVAAALVGFMIGALVAAVGHRVVGIVIALSFLGVCVYWTDSLTLLAYAPPIAGFAFMAWFFQRTLRPGVEPLITRVARREHTQLPIALARYTRKLTWIWVGCFVLLLAFALALVQWLPLRLWSRLIQILGVALPAALFLGEYVYRRYRMREYTHASLPALLLNVVAVIKKSAVARPSSNKSQGASH